MAEPEADAQYLLAHPYGAEHFSAGLTAYANGAVVPTDTLSVQAAKAQHFAAKANAYAFSPYYAGAHFIGKREAEAEAEPKADAQFYGYGFPAYGYSGVYGGYGYPYR